MDVQLRMQGPAAVWLTGLAIVLTGACGSSAEDSVNGPMPESVAASADDASEPAPSSTPPVVAADGPVIVGEPSATMPQAMVSGEVVLDSGCVRLRSQFGGTLIVVWPAGTAWEADRREVVLADGLRIPVGASFEGGGGYYSAARAGEIMPTIRDRVIACLPDGADEATADQVVLAWPSRLVELDAKGPPPAPTLETSLPPASTDSVGGITRPPGVTVASNATTLDLEAWTFCFANGCADGFPPDPLPSVGADDELEVRFPLEGWGFQADFQRAGDPCARHQYVDLEQTGPTSFVLRPAGPAGTYAVTLFGRGDGDLFVTFEWKTTSDGPLPKPEAQLAVLADHDGRIDSYGVELSITNLARSPTSATASITVTAANGNSLSFDAIHRSSGPECPAVEGSLYWDGPDDQGLAAAALGPAPFTYDVLVTLDGIEHSAAAKWPSDQIPGNEPSVALDFTPALPALGE